MALRDLVKPVSPEFATDREIQGDQVDLKINDLRRDLWAVCDAIDAGLGGGGVSIDLTFTPGAPHVGSVYGDWAAMVSDINTKDIMRSRITVTSNFTVPVGTWNMKGATVQSNTFATGIVSLTVPEGSILDNVSVFGKGISVVCSPSTSHDTFTFTETPLVDPIVLSVQDGAIITNTGYFPLYTAQSGSLFVFSVKDASFYAAPPSITPLFSSVSGATVIGADNSSGPFGGLPDNWLDGSGDLYYQKSAASKHPTISGFTGIYNGSFYGASKINVLEKQQIIEGSGTVRKWVSTVICNCISALDVVTVPDSDSLSGPLTGQRIRFYGYGGYGGGNQTTITPVTGSPTIISTQGDYVDYEWDGLQWFACAGGNSLSLGAAGGDLSGSYPNPTVIGLQTRPVDTAAPAAGESLAWDGTKWTPSMISGGGGPPTGAAGGDLSALYPNPTVVKLRGVTISNTAPVLDQVLKYDGTQWVPATFSFSIPVVTGLTYTTAPTQEGQLYTIVDDNTVDLASATDQLHSEAVLGTWDATNLGLRVIRGYPNTVRLEPALIPISGQPLYVSESTPGLATNIKPVTIGNYLKPIGYILNSLSYNGVDPTGSTVTFILDHIPVAQIT